MRGDAQSSSKHNQGECEQGAIQQIFFLSFAKHFRISPLSDVSAIFWKSRFHDCGPQGGGPPLE